MSDNLETPKVSVLTITRNRKSYIDLMLKNWNGLDYPRDKLEWIILDDGSEDLTDVLPVADNIHYIKLEREEIKKFINMIDLSHLSNNLDKNKISKKVLNGQETDEKAELIQQYYLKTCRLPMGFKRDYGVNLCQHNYIMHMDDDDYYPPNCIYKKLGCLDERRRIQCIYCSEIDTYNFVTGKYDRYYLPKFCNEATLFHTKEYWNSYKFKWEDIYNEGKYFIYGHMEARAMPCKDMIVAFTHKNNYSMRNLMPIRQFNKMKKQQENKDRNPKALKKLNDDDEGDETIDMTEFNPEDFKDMLKEIPPELNLLDLYDKKENLTILSINSDSEMKKNLINKYSWMSLCMVPSKKFREKELLKDILKHKNKIWGDKKIHFDLLILGNKQPIWNIFKKYIFSVILLENRYNLDQVGGILEQNGYMPITLGNMCVYVAKMYLKTEKVEKKEGMPQIAD